jgi:hypothetical protein
VALSLCKRLEQPYTFEATPEKPAIYSPRVVLVFSTLFSALAGGILTFYSLRSVGQLKAAWQALGASAGYVALCLWLLNLLPATNSALAYGLGYAGGYVLNTFFLKKNVPDEAEYPRKSWVKPLLIWIVVAGLAVWAVLAELKFH